VADLKFDAAMADQGVLSALDKFAYSAEKSAHKSNRAFGTLEHGSDHVLKGFAKSIAGAMGLHSIMELGSKSLEEYAKKNLDVAASLERIGESHREMFASLGRDLSMFTDAGEGVFKWISDKREEAANFAGKVAGFFKFAWNNRGAGFKEAWEGGSAEIEGVNAAMKKSENIQKEMANAALLSANALEHEAKMSELAGEESQQHTDELKAEIEYQAQLKKIAEDTKGKPADMANTMRLRAQEERDRKIQKAQEDADKRVDDAAEKTRKEAKSFDDAREAADKKSNAALLDYDLERKKFALSQDRLHMSDAQAKAVEREIKLQEYLVKLQGQDGLTSSAKALLAAEARAASAADAVDELTRLDDKKSKHYNVAIQAGAGAIGLGAVGGDRTFNAATVPGLNEAREQLKAAQAGVRALVNIDKSTAKLVEAAKGSVGVFGN